MAQRTKRTKMLCKLLYLLSPEWEEHRLNDGNTSFNWTKALNRTLEIFGYRVWENKPYQKAKEQLISDYNNLMNSISDDIFSEK